MVVPLILAALSQAPVSDSVKISQIGYRPDGVKIALLTADPAGDVVVRKVEGDAVVLKVAAGPALNDPDTGDAVRRLDFSSLRRAGSYYLDVPGVGRSFPFRVANDVYARPLRLAMRSFYGQRCGTAVNMAPDFPELRYAACHTSMGQFHASSGKEGPHDVSGGWHDAGDYGKYVVNSGITTGTLLWAYELNPRRLRGLSLDIPESKGRTPDYLAEVKWNLDWMLKMQDSDGGVWHKATTAQFAGWVMPEADKATTFVIGTGTAPFKNTTATADFAAVAAIAARVYRPFDRAYADRCLKAAERAFTWAEANPEVPYGRNPQGIATGGYGDRNLSDERLWAAAELFRTTGKPVYQEAFLKGAKAFSPRISPDNAQGWGDVRNMGMYTYALAKGADREEVARIRRDALAAADALVKRAQANGYLTPMRPQDYGWGSNSGVANYAMMLLMADRFQPNNSYREAARDCLAYLHGRNTFNTSFVTRVGSRWPLHPHHRPSGADGVAEPYPGLLVGGPNANGKPQPARQWRDLESDYTQNETAINWNAPLVFVLALQ